jgi:hypothetical protein
MEEAQAPLIICYSLLSQLYAEFPNPAAFVRTLTGSLRPWNMEGELPSLLKAASILADIILPCLEG